MSTNIILSSLLSVCPFVALGLISRKRTRKESFYFLFCPPYLLAAGLVSCGGGPGAFLPSSLRLSSHVFVLFVQEELECRALILNGTASRLQFCRA